MSGSAQPVDLVPPDPGTTPVFLLCGGLGTRLRQVDARPKAVIPIAGLPFLFYALRLLGLQGFRNIHLLVGEGAERVLCAVGIEAPRSPLSDAERKILEPLTLVAHREESPMGTGGALALVRDCFEDQNLILNADSYAEAPLADLLSAHLCLGAGRLDGVALLAVWEEDRADYGGLNLGPTLRGPGPSSEPDRFARIVERTHAVSEFLEKGTLGEGWINGGVYLAGRRALATLPDGPSSLERDLLPRLAGQALLAAYRCRCFFRDIGTPARLKRAEREFVPIRARF